MAQNDTPTQAEHMAQAILHASESWRMAEMEEDRQFVIAQLAKALALALGGRSIDA